MLATIILRPAAFRMICAFRKPFNCEDAANGVSLYVSPDIRARVSCVSRQIPRLLCAIAPEDRAGALSADGHEALIGGLHVVTVRVGRAVNVAQIADASVGIEDERATIVGEQVSGAWVVIVE
jgi:hypothetical protein